jgi:hypothetical protein
MSNSHRITFFRKPQALGVRASIAALGSGRRFGTTCRGPEGARLRGRALGGEPEFFQHPKSLPAVLGWTQASRQ